MHCACDARTHTLSQTHVSGERGQRCGHRSVPAIEPRSRPRVDASSAPCARLALGGGARTIHGGADGLCRVNRVRAMHWPQLAAVANYSANNRRSLVFRRPSRARYTIAARGQNALAQSGNECFLAERERVLTPIKHGRTAGTPMMWPRPCASARRTVWRDARRSST